MRKSKGYAKGGAKMMKARGGRMASKGGSKMMGAMKGKMASKGYAKGGAKMMKAKGGNFTNIKGRTQGRGTASDKEFKEMSLATAKKVLKANNMKAIKV